MIDAGLDITVHPRGATHVVIIAASTGGPSAIKQVVSQLPPNLGAAVLIAQHMPKPFTTQFAEHLNQTSALPVTEGVDGELVFRNCVYVAPGGTHMRIVGCSGRARLSLDSEIDTHRVSPSADLLLESATQVFASRITAVILTGMGRDGSVGLRMVRDAGGHAIVQHHTSALISSMPQSALEEAGADYVVPLDYIADAIVDSVNNTMGRSLYVIR
jgi:two-component system chemotaxis response regulator CheB